RLSLCIISIALIIVIFIKPNQYNNKILHFETENTHNFNPVKQAQQDGYIPAFMDTVKPHYMQKPTGYKKKNMKKLYEKYTHTAQELNEYTTESADESHTSLYLRKSLTNPKRVPHLLENESPLPGTEKIIKKNVGRNMNSHSMGGTTANLT